MKVEVFLRFDFRNRFPDKLLKIIINKSNDKESFMDKNHHKIFLDEISTDILTGFVIFGIHRERN